MVPLAVCDDMDGVSVQWPAAAAPALKPTFVLPAADEPEVADTVLVSALVDVIEPVTTPAELVEPTGCVIVLPVPVLASVTPTPEIGLS